MTRPALTDHTLEQLVAMCLGTMERDPDDWGWQIEPLVDEMLVFGLEQAKQAIAAATMDDPVGRELLEEMVDEATVNYTGLTRPA
jgi:hypothetical protein